MTMQKRDVKFKLCFVNDIEQAIELMLEPVHLDMIAVAMRVDMRFELSASVRSVPISIDLAHRKRVLEVQRQGGGLRQSDHLELHARDLPHHD